jgi:peptidoglycan/xylan/chitin deacetylase (PgdA/CDA1 family)
LSWTPILIFHEVVPDGTLPVPPYGITQSGLRRVLRDFARRGYTPGTLDDVVPSNADNRSVLGTWYSVLGKRLVLTFDDGTRDFLEYALPVLEEFGFSATLFVVAGMVGGTRSWGGPGGGPGPGPVPLMDAAELRALHQRGFTIGSHTLTHCALPHASPQELAKETVLSRQILSDMLGEPVRWFAYPYLMADAKSRAAVREAGYSGACGGYSRPHERFYLNRIDPSAYSLRELRLRTNGFVHAARQAARSLRTEIRSQKLEVRSQI